MQTQTDIGKLFEAPIQHSALKEIEIEKLSHYVMNLTEQDIYTGAENILDDIKMPVIPRGLIVPLFPFERWENEADYQNVTGGIRDKEGHILRTRQPGQNANALMQKYALNGMFVISSLIGIDQSEAKDIAALYDFRDVPKEKRPKDYRERTLPYIKEQVYEIQAAYAKEKLIVACGEDVKLGAIQAEFNHMKQLSDRRDAIMNQMAGKLDPAHELMCRWIERDVSEFELSGTAQAMAMQSFMKTIAAQTAAQATGQPGSNAPSYKELQALSKQQAKQINDQNERLSSLEANIEKLLKLAEKK